MTLFTLPLLKRRMRDLVDQAFVLGTMCFMTSCAVSAPYLNTVVGLCHGWILEIVTTLAKGRSCVCQQTFNICVVGHMAFQTQSFPGWCVLKCVPLQIGLQVRVT